MPERTDLERSLSSELNRLRADASFQRLERGLGYWITPELHCIPFGPDLKHWQVFARLRNDKDKLYFEMRDDDLFTADGNKLDNDEADLFRNDPLCFAQKHGFSRVRIYPGGNEPGRADRQSRHTVDRKVPCGSAPYACWQ